MGMDGGVTKPTVFVQPTKAKIGEYLSFARESGFSLEIVDFASVDMLNDEASYRHRRKFYRKELEDFDGGLSLHGPFLDLKVYSLDHDIRRASRKRVRKALETADRLGAAAVVFHTNFSPLIRNPRYLDVWVEKNAAFWRHMLEEYGASIYLENLWEENPAALGRLLSEVDSPRLGACFDVGHFNVFSRSSLSVWFQALEEFPLRFHLNDNWGNVDRELPPGQGSFPWRELDRQVEKLPVVPDAVLEVENLRMVKQGITYLKERSLYPFGRQA